MRPGIQISLLVLGFNVILCRLSEKGRREIEEIVEEMKEREGGKKRELKENEGTEEIITSPPPPLLPLPATRTAALAQL